MLKLILFFACLQFTALLVMASESPSAIRKVKADSMMLTFLIEHGDYGPHLDSIYLIENLNAATQGYFYSTEIYNFDEVPLSAFYFFATDSHSKRYIGLIAKDSISLLCFSLLLFLFLS